MTARVVVDGRLLATNRAGIGRYLGHLYRAVAALEGAPGLPAALSHPRRAITVLYSRRDKERLLRAALPGAATAWTPAHHRLERWALALEGARLRPSLWHAPDHVAPQPLGWRTVLTVHDLAFWRYPETHAPASRAYYAGLRRSVGQATRVICVSQATRRDLLAATGVAEEKVRVVPEAPDPLYGACARSDGGPNGAGEAGAGVEAARRGEAPGAEGTGRPYFVAVGTIEPRKNLATLFRALAHLPPEGRPELRVVGAPGWGAEAIVALPQRLGLGGDVRFLGRLPTRDVAALYRGALALVYPSLLEGFGLPVLEAMAAGAPVVAARRSSIPEVAGEAALLVDPEDVDGLAAALERVAGDGALRDDLRRRGRAHVLGFTWERAARETLAVFDEALRA